MALPKPPSPPPLSVDFQSTLHSSQPGAEPTQHDWKLHRSSDGKTRYDHGDHSVITDPAKQQVTLLDHVNKQAHVFPMPIQPPPAVPGGGVQSGSSAPASAPPIVKDLGKRMIAGHEVEGKSYTLPPPAPPATPPSVAPPIPPKVSAPPSAPGSPPPPPASSHGAAGSQTVEVWTSHKFQLPLASSVTGASGKQTTIGKQITPGEPHPSTFQVPAGYELVPPPKPPAPSH
jgi:hypothetical protein